jgi:hypothetical protein
LREKVKYRLYIFGRKLIEKSRTPSFSNTFSHNSATEALRITLDQGIIVETDARGQETRSRDKDRQVILNIKKQTLVNLTGMSGYGSMNDDGTLNFVFKVENKEVRDQVIHPSHLSPLFFYNLEKSAKSKIFHSL